VVALFGSLGLGLVWGWLIGNRTMSLRDSVVLSTATLLATIEVVVLAGAFITPSFLGAVTVAFMLHVISVRELRSRFDRLAPSSLTGGHE
jgi:hypothetical protein